MSTMTSLGRLSLRRRPDEIGKTVASNNTAA